MVSFSDLKNSFRFQRDAKRVQKELKNIHVEAENPGIRVIVSASLEIISIEVAPEIPSEKVGALLMDALNRALKKAQVISAERMQSVMGDMGFSPKA